MNGFFIELGLKYTKYNFMTSHGKYDFLRFFTFCYRHRRGTIFVSKFVS